MEGSERRKLWNNPPKAIAAAANSFRTTPRLETTYESMYVWTKDHDQLQISWICAVSLDANQLATKNPLGKHGGHPI